MMRVLQIRNGLFFWRVEMAISQKWTVLIDASDQVTIRRYVWDEQEHTQRTVVDETYAPRSRAEAAVALAAVMAGFDPPRRLPPTDGGWWAAAMPLAEPQPPICAASVAVAPIVLPVADAARSAVLSVPQAQAVLDLLAVTAGAAQRGMHSLSGALGANAERDPNYRVHSAVVEALRVIARDIKWDARGDQSLSETLERMQGALARNDANVQSEFRV